MSSTGVSSLRLGPMCLPIGQRFGRTRMVSCARWCQRCRPQPQCWLGKLGKRKSDTIFLSSPACLWHISQQLLRFDYFHFFILSAWFALCLFECSQEMACMSRKRCATAQLRRWGSFSGGFNKWDSRLLCGPHGWRCFEQHAYTGWRVGTFLVLIEAEAEALNFF